MINLVVYKKTSVLIKNYFCKMLLVFYFFCDKLKMVKGKMKKCKYYISRLFGSSFKKLFEVINIVHKRSGKNRIYLFFDIVICSIRYLAGYTDYMVFWFENLSHKQRKTFITRGVSNEYIKKLNNSKYYDNFDNKIKFNNVFKNYINRDFVDLSVSSFDEFKTFIDKHKIIIVKPVDGICGKGVEKINTAQYSNVEDLYNKLKCDKQLLVEECIVQNKALSDLFPNSVNTIRLVTIRKKHKTVVIFRVIRIGNGNNVVDNYNHGGMFSLVSEDGIVTKPAIDKKGNIYEYHPVTKTPIVGFKIPYFKESLDMVVKASEVIEEVGYVGWDIAITNNGPVLIEGNQLPGYDLYQSKIHLNDDNTGFKPLFDKVIYKD